MVESLSNQLISLSGIVMHRELTIEYQNKRSAGNPVDFSMLAAVFTGV
jgi:hypothetical protein